MREKEFLPYVRDKLGIAELNPMQTKMMQLASEPSDIILLSPTGSGKTLAFILPVLKILKAPTGRIQAVVIAPSRELVMQIAGILRDVARGFKTTALYGGHNAEDEKNSLSVVPDIVVATPGRLLDHANRRNLDLTPVRVLVLDEFDKSLELGFESEMKRIMAKLKNVSRVILTSATDIDSIPDFVPLKKTERLDYLGGNRNLRSRLRVHRVNSDGKDKLETLLALLHNIMDGPEPDRTIIFVNHRESAERVAEYLRRKGVDCVLYHGALDQRSREKAIAMFNAGTAPVLVATDLASRGLDIEKVADIIHYHQPLTAETYTHRNGRTARVSEDGDVFLLIGPDEDVKDFVEFDDTFHLDTSRRSNLRSSTESLFISAGKKEKLSKGDIAGCLIKEGGLEPSQVGRIDVFDHYSLAVVPASEVDRLVTLFKSRKIKGEKRRLLPADKV